MPMPVRLQLVYTLSIFAFTISTAALGIKNHGLLPGILLGIGAFISGNLWLYGAGIRWIQKEEIEELNKLVSIPEGKWRR
jgi:hypothetical protein